MPAREPPIVAQGKFWPQRVNVAATFFSLVLMNDDIPGPSLAREGGAVRPGSRRWAESWGDTGSSPRGDFRAGRRGSCARPGVFFLVTGKEGSRAGGRLPCTRPPFTNDRAFGSSQNLSERREGVGGAAAALGGHTTAPQGRPRV